VNVTPSPRRSLARLIQSVTIVIALLLATGPAQAYVLTRTGSCTPGARWSTSLPVKVKLLADSFTAYATANDIPAPVTAGSRLIDDIKAVIAEYNAVPGSALKLEYAAGISGDDDLDPYPQDSFDPQTIVIGFSTGAADSSESAPAWTPSYPEGACTITRAHVFFKRDALWTFGPPASTDVTTGKKFDGGYAFRAVLLHEMGHAVGLAHETDAYAVMDHGTKAWTRGAGEVPQMELLPDDSLGLLKLYGGGAALQGFDVSLTNTSYQTAEQLTEQNAANDKRHPGCAGIEASLAELKNRRQELIKLLSSAGDKGLPAAEAELASVKAEIGPTETALWECRYREKTAEQVEQCKVSSHGDSYAPQSDGSQPFCGVNDAPSAYPSVGDTVCPGDLVQVRYTANNKSSQDVKLQEQLWFSADDALITYGAGVDLKSPDEREYVLGAGRSHSLGRVYRVPAGTLAGRYKLFAFVFADNPSTGASLNGQEADHWNNGLRLHGTIRVRTAGCS
jgi:Matrixin